MRQLHSNWVEYSLIPHLFHFLSFPVPIPSSERQWEKQRLKVTKQNKKNPPILLHTSWIQPLLLWIHFPIPGVLKNSSGGSLGKKIKNCFVKCWQRIIFLFLSLHCFSSAQLLVVVRSVQAPSERIIPACSPGPLLAGPHCPPECDTPAHITLSISAFL